ncbi:MAG TPA: protein-L-isoaspartate O-methyltransferase [Casimicrobiaceae bacterium]|jgi:protein-L-isoaspartate(D-aspartate) O-methyltransferase|nr:protein-L-isoaspartate O-methyltransferase [Casimicrobiaceae bacterium]HWD34523.1 protein-L-isoaspartate O-methyltransferase [Casimicrobiaceae bacterium]
MTRFDYEQARFNMIEQQIRPWDVLDTRVLDLLFAVHREDFVPQAYRTLALADLELPLGNGYRMWTPKMEARVLQELMLRQSDRVLEIGTGAGYLTALMASQAGDVTTVEIDAPTAEQARATLARQGFANVRVEVGDGARGFGRDTYDAIVLTASTPMLPEAFFAQLTPNGRLFAVVGEKPAMRARLVHAESPGALVATDLFETVIAPLVNAATPARFEF